MTFVLDIYIPDILADVAESAQEPRARAHILMQDSTCAAVKSQSLGDQVTAVPEKTWKTNNKIRVKFCHFSTVCPLLTEGLMHQMKDRRKDSYSILWLWILKPHSVHWQ